MTSTSCCHFSLPCRDATDTGRRERTWDFQVCGVVVDADDALYPKSLQLLSIFRHRPVTEVEMLLHL